MPTTILPTNTGPHRIHTVLMGRQFKLEEANDLLVKQKGAIRYRDAYQITLAQGEAWVFNYGVVVCWNIEETARKALCRELSTLMTEHLDGYETEQFHYHIAQNNESSQGDNTPAKNTDGLTIHNDFLSLPNNKPLCRLALSHAFAQSAKLSFFEDTAQQVIEQNSYISKQLAATGKIPLSRNALAKLRGVLFDTSNDISLHFNLLDTPEFFWDYPELEHDYRQLAKYLDLAPRIEILNHKLATIHSLLDMLASEQHHKHSSFLEWIIIVLIMIDIVIYFFPK